MPGWPFRRRSNETRAAALPPELERIAADSPRRFRLALADPAQLEAALDTLRTEMGPELSIADGRAETLELASTFMPGTAAVLRPLNVLERGGIKVRHLELLDLVATLADAPLRRVVEDWGEHGNTGPYRLRVERLSGMDLLERCLAERSAAGDSRPGRRSAWDFAVICIAFNTPGAERRVLEEAAASSDQRHAESLVQAAHDRVWLATLGGLGVDVPPSVLAELIGRPGYLSERASRLAAMLPGPMPVEVVSALLTVAEAGGERGVVALGALRNASATHGLRATVERAIASDDADMRAAGLDVLAHHWGSEARPIWKAFLASRSGNMRWVAEAVLGLHGSAEDLPDAAAHIAKLARARPAISMSPPRGNEIVDLLVRYREDPTARAALDDLSARWDRMPADLREWLAEHHAWLDPARRGDRPLEAAAAPEEELLWPPPAIERDGAVLTLQFDEAGARHPVRDRFEDLANAHPAIQVLEGDREWLSLKATTPNADALVLELWDAAGRGDEP